MQPSTDLGLVPRVDLQEAKAEFDRAAALFVDVRSREDYAKCHIPGAVSVPLAEISAHFDELLGSPSVITYCT